MTATDYSYSKPAKIIHLSLAVFGVLAYVTGELAEDGGQSLGYSLHSYLGLTLMAAILLRFIHGQTSRDWRQLSSWSPLSKDQWKRAVEDVWSLLKLKMPERGMHEGLAGLTQAFGLFIFSWMGATGTVLFFLGGGPESDIFELIEELHEVGEALIPLFLLLHVGSVMVHSITGHSNWKKMWSFGDDSSQEKSSSA